MENPINTISGSITISSTGTAGIINTMDMWGTPERVAVNEYPDRIEIIYKQTSMLQLTSWPAPPPETRVYKIVFSCVNGQWHKSEPIFGTIVPASNEYYLFD